MKFSKLCCMFAAASFAVGAFADAANVLISFSTEADYYADNTPVLNGEWYALCWSPRDTFGGLTLECEPVNADERVLILAPLAEGGHCPYVLFQIDSKKTPTGGNYFVYLLDTRDVTGTTPAAVAKNEAGRPVPASVVNGSAVAQSFTASASVGSSVASTSAAGASVANSDWAAVQPKITAFEVKDAKVKITVAGMMSGLEYKVSMGENLDEMSAYSITPQTKDGEAFFLLDASDARFFKVVTE